MLESRKFKAVIIDAVFSILVYWASHFLAPGASEHALFLIGAVQPVVIAYVLGTAWEDAAAKARWGASISPDFSGDDEAPVK